MRDMKSIIHFYSDYDYYDDYANNLGQDYSLRHILRNKRTVQLLERNNDKEIKKLLSDFLAIAAYYNIAHNLSSEEWFTLIYHPENFEVKSIIRDHKKNNYDYSETTSENKTQFQNYFGKNTTDYFFESRSLQNVFENIENIKTSTPFLDSIHVFMWFSFFFAMLIFMFRVTGLRALLFSIVSVGVLILVVTLIMCCLYIIVSNEDALGYFLAYLTLLLGSCILLIPIFFAERIKKAVVAICLNISMTGFVFYCLLLLVIIAMHQRDYCNTIEGYRNYNDCKTIFNVLDFNWSFVLFFAGLIFMFFYVDTIKKWKSLPEG